MKNIKSILLVEDDKDDQYFFIKALSEMDDVSLFSVANNGQEALDLLRAAETLPALIFMDINMPVMNGVECLSEMVVDPRIRDIPVVILTTSTEQREHVLKLGASAFIKKPYTNEALRNELIHAVNAGF